MIVLEIGTTPAVINFNDGLVGLLRVIAIFGIIPSSDSIACYNEKGKARIYQMNRKEMDLLKHQRKRAIQRGFGDRGEEKEEKTNGTGDRRMLFHMLFCKFNNQEFVLAIHYLFL